MKERPILFNADMVRAILDGSKTQTRRMVKPQPAEDESIFKMGLIVRGWITGKADDNDYPRSHISCPFGESGDRLWVRETWRHTSVTLEESRALTEDITSGCAVDWRADYVERMIRDAGFSRADAELSCEFETWKPSIHMPRWASRILLEITNVRVERLQDISEADAKSEGAAWGACGAPQEGSHKAGFAQLWESINGPGSWEANPWVWVIEFKVAEP